MPGSELTVQDVNLVKWPARARRVFLEMHLPGPVNRPEGF